MQVAQPGPRHEQTRTCVGLAAQLQQHATVTTAAEALNERFTAYGTELTTVGVFKYLGRMLAGDDNDTQAVRVQLMKTRGTWARLGKVLQKENVPPQISGMFYRATI